MLSRIRNPEVRILATYSLELQGDYPDEDEDIWQDSPFNWIRTRRSSRQRGAIGEKLISGYLALKGFDVLRTRDSGADRIIGGKRAEIKMSTLWSGGLYKFQQLRDQEYEFVICLGVSPFDAHCWVIPKNRIMIAWRSNLEGISSQHSGSSGTDTAWINVDPKQVPSWLDECGGTLSEALVLIRDITGQEPLM